MGYCANNAPTLFKSIVFHVPFVDVLNTMLDDKLPLTPLEYKEWGNPAASVEYFEYIKSYCPYSNVSKQNYPNIFITSGINDPRVTYWEPLKLFMKLQKMKLDDNLMLLKTNMEGGHKGKTGRYDYIEEIAQEFTFVLNNYK